MKARTDTKGEASLRGHLKSDGDEKTGSQSYVPPDAKDDKALKMAADLLHGVKVNATGAGDRRQGRDRQAGQQGGELIRFASDRHCEQGGLRAALFAGWLWAPAGPDRVFARAGLCRGLAPPWYRRSG